MTIEQKPELNRFVDPSITKPWQFRWQWLKLFLPLWLYILAFCLELGLFGSWVANKPLLKCLPKPMLRVQGKPILEHIIAGIVAAGVREIFIVTGSPGAVLQIFRSSRGDEALTSSSKWFGASSCLLQIHQT
jgi:hypothetical protein